MLNEITDLLQCYPSITLNEMKGVRLMNRIDTKYVLTLGELPALLEAAAADYYVQTNTCGERLASYRTVYYDTPACDMFRGHQSGHLPRLKVRMRTYQDTGEVFLEVKRKNNHGRTAKKRSLLAPADTSLTSLPFQSPMLTPLLEKMEGGERLLHHSLFSASTLTPQLQNGFQRITLVNLAKTERLTIDLGVHFHNLITQREEAIDQLVIVELKREGTAASTIQDLLLASHIHPKGFSKYCIGQALTNPQLPLHYFKEKLQWIQKLSRQRLS